MMIVRRNFLFGIGATLLAAPVIVPAASLMPIRAIILPPPIVDTGYYGFADRLFVHTHLRQIVKLQNTGLSAQAIAAELNRRGQKFLMEGSWNAERVAGVVSRDQRIRASDAYHKSSGGH
jgi:hypothetical protein